MSDIYVTGHRNPDTDAIVAAMSYAHLRNALGDREYKAVRIGGVNDETQRLLDHFGMEAPPLVKNMRTQVRDLDYDRTPALNSSVTMSLAWQTMRDSSINAVPIVDDDGKLFGMLSAGDLAAYDMQTMYENRIEDLPLFNLISVLEGTLVNEYSTQISSVTGELFITIPQNYDDPALTRRESILICGDQPEVIERAIAAGVQCLIICRADIRPEWAEVTDTCIISTPLSARRVSRVIYLALPVGRVSQRKDIIFFHLSDYLDDVREQMLKSRYRSYPILDENDQVVGTLARFHLLRPRRKRVVLVDHNEAAQSVAGLEQVEILEIIDHHRLADIQTGLPIHVRNEPVGSTNTIITAMYQENGVVPSPKIAGLMAGAILSDTVMFKSPTCTKRDITMAERLARYANVSLEELGKELFAAGGSDAKSADELFKTDYKQFHISGQNIGVSQITSVDSERLLARKEEFMQVMQQEKKDKEYDLVILMITDVLLEGSHLFYVGSDEVIQQAFTTVPKDNHVFLPGVMSRKKQIIPMLTALWG
ncbi:MAG: putative manganese-dependent inorganic diphosphatase [Oscillospiraceae bacterium]|nr:putative manganese-dependent inorganic diphosphatase [Oscillospiraceae bacterium]